MNGDSFKTNLASCLEPPVEAKSENLRLHLDSPEYPIGDLRKLTEMSLWSIATHSVGLPHGFPCLVTIKDAAGRYVFVNETWETFFHKTPAEWYLRSDTQLWDAVLSAKLSATDRVVRRELSPRQEEVVLSLGSTSTSWLMAKFPLELQPGEVSIGCVAVDITERKAAETALQESENRYRDLFRSVLTGIYRSAPDGHVLLANPAMARMLGYRNVDELISRNAAEFYADRSARKLFVDEISRAGQVHGLEVELRRVDGSLIQVRETAKAVYGSDGQVSYFEGVIEDVTGLRRSEAIERQRNAILEMVARNEPLPIILRAICALAETQYPNLRCFVRTAREATNDVDLSSYGRCQSTPILSISNETLGTFTVCDRRGEIADDQQTELLCNLQRMAGLAIEHRQLYEGLEYQANHDLLTGLPNRVLFADRLDQALTSAREKGHHVAVLWIDLDRFKDVNDALGHRIGDLLLTAVSGALQSCVTPGETLARMGGDEFTLLIPNVVDRLAAKKRAQNIVDTLRAPFLIERYELFVTCSIGICVHPEDGLDVATLQRNADGAMYRAKAAGRNLYVDYEPKIGEDAIHRRELECYLRHAVQYGEFELFYQPQADLQGRIIAAEALIRWNHPKHGLLGPGEFIELAEETGLIQCIGRWIIEEACRAKARWTRLGYPDIRVAVNISPLQVYYGDLPEVVRGAIAQSGIPAEALELELTESLMLRNFDEAIRQMERLRALGVTLAMDDFGTGYSSLSYLQRLPIDLLKLDRSFVSQIELTRTRAVVSAILTLAHSLGLKVIAEGVERLAQLELVRAAGVDLVQGYLISRPIPESSVVNLFGSISLL